jgi:hypothetical protein
MRAKKDRSHPVKSNNVCSVANRKAVSQATLLVKQKKSCTSTVLPLTSRADLHRFV